MQITFSTSFFLCPCRALLIYLASAFHNIRKQMLNKLIKRTERTEKGGVIMVAAYINNTRMPEFLIKKLPLSYLTQGMYSTQQRNSKILLRG